VFSPITDLESAHAAAKAGAGAGFVFAGMYVIGALMQYRAASSHSQDEAIAFVAINAVLISLILFLSWRVKTGRGFISTALLLLWFVGECTVKVLAGSTNMGWVFFYLIVAAGLLRGLRGCWKVRQYRHLKIVDTFN
jgi:hypothetical protein